LATSLPETAAHHAPNEKIIDPTENVQNLVKEVVIRIDALREAERRHEESLRTSERRLIESEIRSVREVVQLRADHDKELALKESDRINAIRLVDVNAVAIAAERTNQQAQVLASQLATSAEANRSLVATTAASQKQQLDQIITPILDRLTALEQQQYKGLGSVGQVPTQVQEQLDRITASISGLKESRDRGEGTKGISTSVLLVLVSLGTAVVLFVIQRLMTGGF